MVLICISLINNVEHLFIVPLGLRKNVYSDLSMFNQTVRIFAIQLHEFFVYFGYWPLIRYMICKHLLLFIRLPFVNGFLCYVEPFQYNVAPLFLLLLLLLLESDPVFVIVVIVIPYKF